MKRKKLSKEKTKANQKGTSKEPRANGENGADYAEGQKKELPEVQKALEGSEGKIIHQVVFGEEIRQCNPDAAYPQAEGSTGTLNATKTVVGEKTRRKTVEKPGFSYQTREDIVTFIFRYKPQDTLERARIIESPPGAVKSRRAAKSVGRMRVPPLAPEELFDSGSPGAYQEESNGDDFPEQEILMHNSQAIGPDQSDIRLTSGSVLGSSESNVQPNEFEPLEAAQCPDLLMQQPSNYLQGRLQIESVETKPTLVPISDNGNGTDAPNEAGDGSTAKRVKLEPGLKEEEDTVVEEFVFDEDDAKRLRLLEAELEQIKNRSRRTKTVKREHSPIKVSCPGEMIDLT
ncbi:hypothetical protein NLJ89_g10224 [Agrocybe chaxingu]|uniref:Uncharacterized protein n=1 Tax=Agrocybe chaxingu TaxID=84603 RepID=A0A9W8MR39_9AGAR|nr:hypothetical protein NLJ89_g10224 [Agrocybe chaxingu]